jgi:Flp pilus assembly protein TadD
MIAGCSSAGIRSEFDFGNKLAKNGLWKEAHYRWMKALNAGNNSAAVHNNIGISLEFQDMLKEAEAEYLKALELSPGNEFIKRNLSRLQKRMNPGFDPDTGEDPENKDILKKGGGKDR